MVIDHEKELSNISAKCAKLMGWMPSPTPTDPRWYIGPSEDPEERFIHKALYRPFANETQANALAEKSGITVQKWVGKDYRATNALGAHFYHVTPELAIVFAALETAGIITLKDAIVLNKLVEEAV